MRFKEPLFEYISLSRTINQTDEFFIASLRIEKTLLFAGC
jgi:hypothetical protein